MIFVVLEWNVDDLFKALVKQCLKISKHWGPIQAPNYIIQQKRKKRKISIFLGQHYPMRQNAQ
jgi:hypothetical protein